MGHLLEPRKHDAPNELLELILCRDIYHCRPSELDDEDWLRVRAHLTCIAAENEVARLPTRRRAIPKKGQSFGKKS